MQAVKSEQDLLQGNVRGLGTLKSWVMFGAAVFLVSLPVFIQAPLVRHWPWLSLAATVAWLIGSRWLWGRPRAHIWGDLLFGFSLSWFAGSLYWGWFRWEPLLHLPLEAIAVPLVLWTIRGGRYKVGSYFYLGALLGTIITDLYFYLMDLIPYWRTLLQVDQTEALPILQQALAQIQTPWGKSWALILIMGLGFAGVRPLFSHACWHGHPHKLHWWAFSGAVLGTLLVDGLFLLVATYF